jgi:hypothetical protein
MIFIAHRRADGGVAVVGTSPPTVESRQHPPINSLGASETLDPSHPAHWQPKHGQWHLARDLYVRMSA